MLLTSCCSWIWENKVYEDIIYKAYTGLFLYDFRGCFVTIFWGCLVVVMNCFVGWNIVGLAVVVVVVVFVVILCIYENKEVYTSIGIRMYIGLFWKWFKNGFNSSLIWNCWYCCCWYFDWCLAKLESRGLLSFQGKCCPNFVKFHSYLDWLVSDVDDLTVAYVILILDLRAREVDVGHLNKR